MSKVVPGGATTAHGAGRVTQSATQATTVFSIAAWEQSTSLPESHLKYVSELAALTVDQLGSRVLDETTANSNQESDGVLETMADVMAWVNSLDSTYGITNDVFIPSSNHVNQSSSAIASESSLHLQKLSSYKQTCDTLLSQVNAAFNYITDIDETYTVVAKKTSELHRLCEGLLAEERQLQYFADDLRSKLSHFEDLESISSKFNSTSLSVEDPIFMSLLKRLDDSVTFLQQNPSFLESQSYLLKFKQLQSRGLTLIRDFIVNTLRQVAQQIIQEVKPNATASDGTQKQQSPQELTSIINVKFSAAAPRIQNLCREVETRAATRDYAILLADIQYCYFQQRRLLLQDIISRQLMSLLQASDLFATVRSGSFYLCSLCEKEHEIYNRFFTTPTPALRMLIEGYSTVLYDAVRPVVIRSYDVNMLCMLVRILKEEVMQKLLAPKGAPVLAFVPIIQRLIEDSQERLIFLAEMKIRDDIQSYELTMKAINYPDILIPPTQSSSSKSSATPTTGSADLETDPNDKYFGWYPTLKTTVRLLESLYLVLDSGPFNGLAREAIMACAQTLCAAARLIEKKSKIDGQLFLIKHMCLLNDETRPFKIDFFVTEQRLDFSHIYGLFRKVLNGELTLASIFAFSTNNAIYSILASATPKLTTAEKDLKKDLDVLLSQTMEAFIVSVARVVTSKLLTFLTQASAYLNTRRQRLQSVTTQSSSPADAPLWQQPFAKPDALVSLINECKQSFEKEIPEFASRLRLYLGEHPTMHALFVSIRQMIVETVESFNSFVRREYPPEELSQVTLFSIDDIIKLLDTSVLSNNQPITPFHSATPRPERPASPASELTSPLTPPRTPSPSGHPK